MHGDKVSANSPRAKGKEYQRGGTKTCTLESGCSAFHKLMMRIRKELLAELPVNGSRVVT
jgi:hypothetical protein